MKKMMLQKAKEKLAKECKEEQELVKQRFEKESKRLSLVEIFCQELEKELLLVKELSHFRVNGSFTTTIEYGTNFDVQDVFYNDDEKLVDGYVDVNVVLPKGYSELNSFFGEDHIGNTGCDSVSCMKNVSPEVKKQLQELSKAIKGTLNKAKKLAAKENIEDEAIIQETLTEALEMAKKPRKKIAK